MTTAVDTMALARAERADLADLLVTLEPEQWNAPSLCTYSEFFHDPSNSPLLGLRPLGLGDPVRQLGAARRSQMV